MFFKGQIFKPIKQKDENIQARGFMQHKGRVGVDGRIERDEDKEWQTWYRTQLFKDDEELIMLLRWKRYPAR